MTQTTGRIVQRNTSTSAATLPEIGRIKIGEKKMNAAGKEYPSALSHFRATGNFSQEFYKLYGEKPTSLDIVFVSNNLNEVCNERFEAWKQGKRYGYGDGETFTIWNSETKKYDSGIAKADPRVKALASEWRPMLTLRFVLLRMKGVLGYWSFETSGKTTTIPSIIQSFDYVRDRAQGSIIGFPFSLEINIKKGYSPTDPKTYPMVTLVPNFSEDNIERVKEYIAAGGAINEITTKMVVGEQKLLIEDKK